ncbi:Minichromosome maintenance domain-containing protein 2 [Lamellibrachia satsuma]|nr:Minichromosome maintenance domain-containing protein 2 [Lamellibrachia satsuma]
MFIYFSYQLQSTRDLIGHGQDRRLLQYTGVIIGLSMAHTYTKSARFVCNIEGCRGSTGNHFIRLHIAGAREKQTIRTDFTCTFCGSRLEEDISFRVLGDKINLELVDTETFSRKRGKGHRYQSLVTYVRDDLVCPLEPGETVSVIGLPVFDIDNQTVALEANNIFRHNQLPVTPVVNLNDLPESIQHLYKDRSHSPWRFSLSLAYAFAGDVTPAGTYLHLKLGMLLSLVGYSVQEAGGLDLLAVGWDTLLLQRLLSYAASLADRSIVHSPGTGHLTASVSRDRHGSDACFIEGGSLLLARGGVCLIPELNSVKKATKQLLAHVLESDKVPVELPQRFTRHGAQRFTLPRRSHVWSYTDHISCHAPHLDDLTAPQVVVGKDGIAKTLADLFAMVYFADVSAASYVDHMLTHHTVVSAVMLAHTTLISWQDFKQLIVYARKQKVVFSESAERLIRGYYVASRRVRAVGVHSSTLPLSAIRTITSLAGSHARLSLRQEVTEHDAVMGILLYEESITSRSGYSVLNVQPQPHMRDNNTEHYIGAQRDVKMHQFHQHLNQFLQIHATDLDTFPEE